MTESSLGNSNRVQFYNQILLIEDCVTLYKYISDRSDHFLPNSAPPILYDQLITHIELQECLTRVVTSILKNNVQSLVTECALIKLKAFVTLYNTDRNEKLKM